MTKYLNFDTRICLQTRERARKKENQIYFNSNDPPHNFHYQRLIARRAPTSPDFYLSFIFVVVREFFFCYLYRLTQAQWHLDRHVSRAIRVKCTVGSGFDGIRAVAGAFTLSACEVFYWQAININAKLRKTTQVRCDSFLSHIAIRIHFDLRDRGL